MADKIEGVFLYEKESKVGTGNTEKKVKSSMYCLASEVENGQIEIRYLGANDQPIGEPEYVPKDRFVHDFVFQPYYFERKKAETERKHQDEAKLNKHIAKAEQHAKKKELYSAEFEFKNALKLDEENLRANFGIGNVYLEMGEKEKAKDIFVKISNIDAIFDEKNKHFFNECGIQLRKQKLFDEATDYYQKAIHLSPNDENLFFNLARAAFEKGDAAKAREAIYKALAISPEFVEGKRFLNYMEQKQAEAPSESK